MWQYYKLRVLILQSWREKTLVAFLASLCTKNQKRHKNHTLHVYMVKHGPTLTISAEPSSTIFQNLFIIPSFKEGCCFLGGLPTTYTSSGSAYSICWELHQDTNHDGRYGQRNLFVIDIYDIGADFSFLQLVGHILHICCDTPFGWNLYGIDFGDMVLRPLPVFSSASFILNLLSREAIQLRLMVAFFHFPLGI